MGLYSSSFLLLPLLICMAAFIIHHSTAMPRSSSNQGRQRRLVDKSNLVTLIMQQSCYFQSYNNRLTCNCNSSDTSAYLHLKLKYYISDTGNEIRAVHVQHCKQLLVTLDLRRVDATDVPIHFRFIGKVEVEKIMFEPAYSDRQELELVFNNVQQLMFKKVFVEDTLRLRALNVKEVHFIKSTFAHIPRRGFEVSRAMILNIKESSFMRVSAQSIVVEKTNQVNIYKNEMSMNALDVVYAKDGSHLMISCNRLMYKPVSPECSKTTTTTTTTTTTPTTAHPYYVNQGNLREGSRPGPDQKDENILPELIAGIIAGVLFLILIIFIFVCLIMRRKHKTKRAQEKAEKEATEAAAAAAQAASEKKKEDEEEEKPKKQKAPAPPPPEPKESDFLLGPEDINEEDDDDSKPRIAPPIWLEEIQRNKIFNRQKSLLSQEGLKDVAEGKLEGLEEMPTSEMEMQETNLDELPLPPPVTSGDHSEDEIRESSRTESDEDVDKVKVNGEVDEEVKVESPKAAEEFPPPPAIDV